MPSSRTSIAETIDRGTYTLERNVDIPLKSSDPSQVIRANVYIPKSSEKKSWPVIITYGPYGKDIEYEVYVYSSLDQVKH